MTPEDLRADVPALADVTYMNYGASGPSPRRVVAAATDFIEHHEFAAPGGEGMYPAAFDAYESARKAVADHLGAAPAEVALTQSTTDSINRIAGAIDWAPGDAVVRTDLEHPAGILPWDRLARHRDVEVRVVGSEAGRLDREAYAEAVRGARLVCLSALTWNYGTTLPVAELVDVAHEAGAFVLVDAVQVPGQAPLDVTEWGADAVAAAGHKWLLGLWGAGFLYVDPAVVADLVPGTIGYRGVENGTAAEYAFSPGAARFEVGTTNPAPHVALEAAIGTMEAVGLGIVQDRIERLAGRLADAVPAERLLSPAEPESGLVTVAVSDAEATAERLAGEGIVVRDLPYPESLRASIHAVTTEAEVDALADAIATEW